jgi:UDP-GlcNAc3NAcA epimerase
MIERIGTILAEQKPQLVMVFGDTTSTLAGAIAANKCGIRLAHVEAGIRSFNKAMPEEHNRVLTDHMSSLLFCPTLTSTKNLINENMQGGIFFTGDITYDVTLSYMGKVSTSDILERLNLTPKGYSILTIHRSYNLDNPYALNGIMTGLEMSGRQIVFPIHPHTQQVMKGNGTKIPANILTISPVGYVEMLALEKNAIEVITDSGGMQKEAYWFSTPCITLRGETEWPETTYSGWNVLVGSNPLRINAALSGHVWPTTGPLQMFGNGNATKAIMDLIDAYA